MPDRKLQARQRADICEPRPQPSGVNATSSRRLAAAIWLLQKP